VLIFTFGSSSKLAAAYGLAVSGVMLTTSIAMIPLATTRWAWSLPRAAVLFGFFACIEATFLAANTLKFTEGGFIPLLIGLGLFAAMSNYHWGRTSLLAAAYAAYANSRTMRWFLALKQRLIDHGGVLREGSRVLKEAERIDVFMTSRPVTKETDGVPVVLRAYLKRHGAVAKHVVLLTIDQQQRSVVEPEKRYTITTFGAEVYGIVAAYGYMEKPNVPSLLHEVNAHPEFQKCDLSLANIEIGEEEILIDPALPWLRKLWVGAFLWQLKLSVPAHRYFGLTWHTPAFEDLAGIDHLSKTVVPVFVHADGATIRLPDRDKRV
jgi:KUP system potassium uptake protein